MDKYTLEVIEFVRENWPDSQLLKESYIGKSYISGLRMNGLGWGKNDEFLGRDRAFVSGESVECYDTLHYSFGEIYSAVLLYPYGEGVIRKSERYPNTCVKFTLDGEQVEYSRIIVDLDEVYDHVDPKYKMKSRLFSAHEIN